MIAERPLALRKRSAVRGSLCPRSMPASTIVKHGAIFARCSPNFAMLECVSGPPHTYTRHVVRDSLAVSSSSFLGRFCPHKTAKERGTAHIARRVPPSDSSQFVQYLFLSQFLQATTGPYGYDDLLLAPRPSIPALASNPSCSHSSDFRASVLLHNS